MEVLKSFYFNHIRPCQIYVALRNLLYHFSNIWE